MCYMRISTDRAAKRRTPTARVGVRELRQNLSVYLRRVVKGERLEVTEHGRAVALLVPRGPGASLVERLVADGRAIPPTRQVEDLAAPARRRDRGFGGRVLKALAELRDDSR